MKYICRYGKSAVFGGVQLYEYNGQNDKWSENPLCVNLSGHIEENIEASSGANKKPLDLEKLCRVDVHEDATKLDKELLSALALFWKLSPLAVHPQ